MAGETTVGSIQGFLRLDADQFHREIEKAILEADHLDGKNVDVKVKASTHDAETGLARVSAEADKVDKSAVRMNKSFGDMGGGGMMSPAVIIGGVAAAIALLGPVTGAATAAMGGFVGVAGTGILAFRGYQQEVQKGTALGQYLQGSLQGIKTEFDALGTTAASAMQGDVLSGLSEIRRFLPTINPEVEALAGHLGRAFNTSAKGVVSGLQNMAPLLQDGGRYAEILANKFAEFTASQDFKNFVDYARRELPNVGAALMDVGVGVKDLAVSLAPVGDDLVTIISLLGKGAGVASHFVDAANKSPGAGLFWIHKASDLLGKFRGDTKSATDAVDEHTSHLLTLQSAQSATATALGTTDMALQAAEQAHKQTTAAAAAATLQMQVEGDAAGLLQQQLDKLNGKSINAAQAQNSFDSALANSNKHIAANGKTIDRATTSLDGNSAAAVANRGELIRQVTAAEGVATAMRDNGASQDETRAKMVKMRDEIIKNAREHGLNAAAVQKFIDKIYKIPAKVAPTKLEVDTQAAMSGIAAFQKAIDSLHGKAVTASVHYAYTGTLPNGGRSTAGGLTFADGGFAGVSGSVRAMADGDITGRNATIRMGTSPILWNEAGPEAYIPLAPSKRARSKAIWEETGRMLGATSQSPVQVNVYPTPGQSESEIGSAAAAALMFRMAHA